ncbi:hypothetical protein BpHYR1_035722, partial [Brachionus plicatilis]
SAFEVDWFILCLSPPSESCFSGFISLTNSCSFFLVPLSTSQISAKRNPSCRSVGFRSRTITAKSCDNPLRKFSNFNFSNTRGSRVVITDASPTKSSSPISSLLAIFLGLPVPLCLFPNVFSLSAVLLVAAPLCCRLTCLSGFIFNALKKKILIKDAINNGYKNTMIFMI